MVLPAEVVGLCRKGLGENLCTPEFVANINSDFLLKVELKPAAYWLQAKACLCFCISVIEGLLSCNAMILLFSLYMKILQGPIFKI